MLHAGYFAQTPSHGVCYAFLEFNGGSKAEGRQSRHICLPVYRDSRRDYPVETERSTRTYGVSDQPRQSLDSNLLPCSQIVGFCFHRRVFNDSGQPFGNILSVNEVTAFPACSLKRHDVLSKSLGADIPDYLAP